MTQTCFQAQWIGSSTGCRGSEREMKMVVPIEEGSTQGVKKATLILELKPWGAEEQLSVCLLKAGEHEDKWGNETVFHHTVNTRTSYVACIDRLERPKYVRKIQIHEQNSQLASCITLSAQKLTFSFLRWPSWWPLCLPSNLSPVDHLHCCHERSLRLLSHSVT